MDDRRGAPAPNRWTPVGLLLALLGPLFLASPLTQGIYRLAGDGAAAFGQIALCALVAVVLIVLMFGERARVSSIGLVPPTVRSVLLGLAVGIGVFVALASIALILSKLDLFDNKNASAVVLSWPLPYRIAVATAAGFIEEVLYRGYAIERLTTIVGHRWIAAGITLLAFALAHVPFWGWAAIATPLLGGGFFTLLYLYRRDLIACIVAHSTIDLIGVALLPALADAGS